MNKTLLKPHKTTYRMKPILNTVYFSSLLVSDIVSQLLSCTFVYIFVQACTRRVSSEWMGTCAPWRTWNSSLRAERMRIFSLCLMHVQLPACWNNTSGTCQRVWLTQKSNMHLYSTTRVRTSILCRRPREFIQPTHAYFVFCCWGFFLFCFHQVI